MTCLNGRSLQCQAAARRERKGYEKDLENARNEVSLPSLSLTSHALGSIAPSPSHPPPCFRLNTTLSLGSNLYRVSSNAHRNLDPDPKSLLTGIITLYVDLYVDSICCRATLTRDLNSSCLTLTLSMTLTWTGGCYDETGCQGTRSSWEVPHLRP